MADHRKPGDPDDPDTPEGEAGVEAYESDWYRSLQALAKRDVSEDEPGGAESGDVEEDADASVGENAPEAKTGTEGHDGAEKKKAPEPGEPGLWVVVTPDR